MTVIGNDSETGVHPVSEVIFANHSLNEYELLGVDERPEDVLVGRFLSSLVLLDMFESGFHVGIRRFAPKRPQKQLTHLFRIRPLVLRIGQGIGPTAATTQFALDLVRI